MARKILELRAVKEKEVGAKEVKEEGRRGLEERREKNGAPQPSREN
jgi:hypothetical protein